MRYRYRLPAFLAALLALLWVAAAPAAADPGDRIKSLAIDYRLDSAGVLHVQETFDWQFGQLSHGIQRQLITREPDGDTDQDVVYAISNFHVTSPDPRVSTKISSSTTGGTLDRDRSVVYRIGDPNQYVMTPTATYVISYDVTGAVRSSGSYDELYWDATGSGNPAIDKVTISAAVPGGAQDVRCYAGPVGSTNSCASATKGTTQAEFAAAGLHAGDNVTIGVKIKPGLVTDNRPHLVPRASFAQVLKAPVTIVTGLVAVLVTLAIIAAGLLRARRRYADLRFLDLPPGTLAEPNTQPRIGPSAGGIEIPVRFEPPDSPVAEAVCLADRHYSDRLTAAVLVSLAVTGAIRISGPDEHGSRQADPSDNKPAPVADLAIELLAEQAATPPVETAVLGAIFRHQPEGRREISGPGSLQSADRAAQGVAIREVRRHRWFDLMPSFGHGLSSSGIAALIVFGVLGVIALVFAGVLVPIWAIGQLGGFPFPIFFVVLPVLALVGTALLSLRRGLKGRRSAQGRAICDQVEGFRKYLATAEADQLKFEEGEDIFSRYLPWAIAFDLADRWQRVCRQLVETGRLPEQPPAWYTRFDGSFSAFNAGLLTGSLTTAAAAAPSSARLSTNNSFSSSGFGSGGSAFGGGGGFSGGGGGGGGSSSW